MLYCFYGKISSIHSTPYSSQIRIGNYIQATMHVGINSPSRIPLNKVNTIWTI